MADFVSATPLATHGYVASAELAISSEVETMPKPSVTIITASFNSSRTLKRAVKSVLAQTMGDWSLIIVDDASTDDSLRIALDFAERDPRIMVVPLAKNGGPSVARNVAINRVATPWITVLDADDAYDSRRLEVLMDKARSSAADLIFDQITFIDPFTLEQSRPPEPRVKQQEPVSLRRLLLSERPASTFKYGYLKPVISMRCLDNSHLRYNPRARLAEDFQLYAECLLCGASAILVPFSGYLYTEQMSQSSGRMSPFSKTVYDPESRVEIGDILLERYAKNASPGVLRLLRAYRKWQLLAVKLEKALKGSGGRRLWARVTLLLKNPEAIPLVAKRSRLYQRLILMTRRKKVSL